MGFLSNLVLRKQTESTVLIDIASDSIAGAYGVFSSGKPPVILYSKRVPIEHHASEPFEKAMLRALKSFLDVLVREGAPALSRATGSGRAEQILVSIGAPWQNISIRTEHLDPGETFAFNKRLVKALLDETRNSMPGKLLANESVIGILLNGYETRDPYGKTAHRAAIVVLTSFIDQQVVKGVVTMLRGAFHTRHVSPIAGSSLHYQALHKAFPHERDALMIDAVGPLTSIALVRNGLFVEIIEVTGIDTYAAWGEQVQVKLAELAKRYPLPRTLFLLAQESKAGSLHKKLDAAKLGDLWLSDNPPNIVPVAVGHIASLVRQVVPTPPDLSLLLMAIFYSKQRETEG